MKYNPQIHHRRSIRLKGYDYSQEGAYFITVCCHNRKHFFGKIENGNMKLNAFGTIAHEQWQQLPAQFGNIELDEFQIMPNHMHGIILIISVGAPLAVGAALAGAHDGDIQSKDIGNAQSKRAPVKGAPTTTTTTLGNIIGAYKSIVANECLAVWKSKRPNETMGRLWQRNFFEHIIRNENSLNNIREYIIHNPENWESDSKYSS